MSREDRKTNARLMSTHAEDSDTVALLRQIARLLEYWKLTAFYIAGVLTLWLYLLVTNRL